MTDLFIKLFKYTSVEKTLQKENFLTEVFAYLIKKSSRFRNDFFDLLNIKDNVIEATHEDDILTQFWDTETNSRFDILIKNDLLEIIIENKVDSDFAPSQLKKYRDYLSNIKNKLCLLITITKSIYEDENFNYADYKITWYELFEKLLNEKGISNYEPEYRDYFYNLNFFLKENDMGIERVTWDIARGLEAENNLIKQIDVVFNDLVNKEFKELKIPYAYKAHNFLGFYFIKGISKNNLSFNIYYILDRVTIYCETEKKNFKFPENFQNLFWDDKRIEIDRFEITKERYLGLDLNEQIEVLKSWGRKCIQKFLDNII
jgi:hypothetical protein